MKLTIDQVTKRYGDVIAADHVSFEVKPGIIGLLGANGSGKTTLLRMIANVLPYDEGNIFFDDQLITENRERYLSKIGYMPQHLGMYPSFRITEFLQYMGAIKGLNKTYTTKRIEELLPAVHLDQERKKKIKALSGGMRQRLGIAQALLNDPELLILDEPTAGLDPKERNQFSRLLASLSSEKIILLSTHIVSDVEAIADHIIIMKKGKIIAIGKPAELLQAIHGIVKERVMSHEELNKLQLHITITQQKESAKGLLVRYLDPSNTLTGTVVDATLNDLYLYYFEEEEDA